MQSLDRNGVLASAVKKALHSPNRRLSFRYELLDQNNQVIGDLKNILSCTVEQQALSTIKRTAKFSLVDNGEIDFLKNRIKPYVQLLVNGIWVEFPQGVFLLSSPTKKDINNNVIRDIEAFDGLLILNQDKFQTRYTITQGTTYYSAIINILASAGITRYNIELSNTVLPIGADFEAGKEKLVVINELLRQINYTPLHVDENGVYTSYPYRSPSIRAIDYTYQDDENSVTFPGVEEELDLFEVPNIWVVVCSNPEQVPMYSVYTNSNPLSLTSTVNQNRNIVDYREIQEVADQQSLDAYTQRIAFEASQIYGKVTFETAIMPMHGYADVLEVDYSPLGIKDKYAETSWSFPLKAGGRMKHEVRRVVSI